MPTLRRCNHCQKDKPLAAFSRSRNRSAWCRDRCAESARKWRAANLEQARAYDRERQDRQRTGKAKEWARFYRWLTRHGLRPEDYHALYEAQNGKCAICGGVPDGPLHIDHDHDTGQVRGLLCPPCNMGLGSFRDNAERLVSAAAYLASPPANGVLTDSLPDRPLP